MTDSDNPQTVPERIAASIRNQFDSEDSRRTFLQRTAAAGGGLLLLGTGTTFAQQDDQSGPMFDDQPGTDLDVLNYLLGAKRLQRDLYTQGVEEFSEGDFGEGGGETTEPEDEGDVTPPEEEDDGNETTAPDDGTTSPDDNTTSTDDNETSALQEAPQDAGSLYATIEELSSQKEEHVALLEQTVQLLGGEIPESGMDGNMTQQEDDNTTGQSDDEFEDTVQPPDEDDNTTAQPQQDDTGTTQPGQFEFESPDDFLQTASAVDNTVVGAHAGAAGFIESPDLLNAVLSIYSVDARSAAVMNGATGQPPSPEAFGQALSQSEVQDAIGQVTGGASGGAGEDTGMDEDMGTGEDDTGDENETSSISNLFG